MSAPIPHKDEEFTIETRHTWPAHYLLKIESFSLLSQKYESTDLVAGDYKWKLTVYPPGSLESGMKDKDHISAYLAFSEASSLPQGWEVDAVFTIFLYNQNLDNFLCFRGRVGHFHALKSEWGFAKLISKKYFTDPSNGYLVVDNCFFGAEVFVVKSQHTFECLFVSTETSV